MAEDIPSPCDLIVVGTGLVESIVAAAASRIGKQVVHIDHRDFYGSSWASFSFNNLQNTLGLAKEHIELLDKNEDNHLNLNFNNPIHNVVEEWNVTDEGNVTNNSSLDCLDTSKESSRSWTKSEILQNFKKFNFDLSPKVLYSCGEMVDLLIKSGICRYAEFKNISGIYMYDDIENNLVLVPCSRSDVFNSKEITMIEKRLLMKILSMCMAYEKNPQEMKELELESFGSFLTNNKIQGKIRRYLVDSVAMVDEAANFVDAVKNVQKFVRSIGRYGNTPFLWTLYGSGELPQCFCRCSAVFGGVYCLKRPIESVIVDSVGKATGIMSNNKEIEAKHIVIEDCLINHNTFQSGVSRAILITDRALVPNDQATLINFPSLDGRHPVKILELSASTMACPKDFYVVHLISRQSITAVEDLKGVISKLFCCDNISSGNKPSVIWSLYFNMQLYEKQIGEKIPSNVYLCSGPDSRIDLDDYVLQAQKLFQAIFPEEEFLPRVPEPEDIILDGVPEDLEQNVEK